MKCLRVTDEWDVYLTPHAGLRMASLQISEDDVRSTLLEPLVTSPGGPGHAGGRREYRGPHVLVVLAIKANRVVTVKLATAVPYAHGIHHRFNLPVAA